MPICHLRADCVDLPAPGSWSARRQLSRPNRSLPAITLPISTKASLSTADEAKAAAAAPTATPATEGSAQARTTSIITAPWSRWARNDSTFVGTMMASEVPTQSWKRTSSGTPSARNTSYRTGTMSAPPPMPNRPARMPVTTPPAMISAASSRSSLTGTPRIIRRSHWLRRQRSRCGGVRHLHIHVHDEGKRVAERCYAGAGLDRLRRQVPAEGARAGDAAEQPEDVARDGVKAHAARKLALDIGDQRFGRRPRRGKGRVLAEQHGIDGQKTPRLLIGGAPHHDTVDAHKMRRGLIEVDDAAVEHDGQIGMRGLEPIDAVVVERRDVAVLARGKPVDPSLARMHDARGDAGPLDCACERHERFFRILLVDADAAHEGDRHRDLRRHGGNAVAHQRGLRHQAGAEATLLHPVGRAADIEVDLVVAEIGGEASAFGELGRLAATKLQRKRMLGRVISQEPRAVAMEHRAGGDHLGVDQRAAREQAMEEPAMAVGPFHHRGDTEFSAQAIHFVSVFRRDQRAYRGYATSAISIVHLVA